MEFEVTFTKPSFGSVAKLQPWGSGRVILDHTAMILMGRQPRVGIPLLGWMMPFIATIESLRTVPYSAIARYSAPSALRRYHILYLPVNRTKLARLCIKLERPRERNNLAFAERLQELRSLTGNPSEGGRV